MSSVASPPSSTICVGPRPSPKSRARSVTSQYSSRVSPFQAKTGMPAGLSTVPVGPTATAAAAWSWVEKMLHEHQRTSAPSAFSVSASTAVWIVMCRLPVMRWPLSGCLPAYSLRTDMRPGISCSARRISLRPHSARERSATLNSRAPLAGADQRRRHRFLSPSFTDHGTKAGAAGTLRRGQDQGRALGRRAPACSPAARPPRSRRSPS